MKKTAVLLLVLVLLVSFAACGEKEKTSDVFDDSVVKEKAENVINLLNSGDYASVEYMVREDLKDRLSAQVLEDALAPIFEQAGEFDSFGKEQITGSTGNDSEEYAIAVVQAKYENTTHIFTITFDRDYHIAGLYMK